MMTKQLIIYVVLFITTIVCINAQENKGEVSGRIFANFHTSIDGDDFNEFELQRAYLTYKNQMSENFRGFITLDVGSSNDLPDDSGIRRYAFFKNAGMQYRKNDLTVQFGLISMQQFKPQESFWGKRYMHKSFCDEYKFCPSADLGVMVMYKLTSTLTADVGITNGEGARNLESDGAFKYGMGLTYTSSTGIILRGYYDVLNKEEARQSINTFIGYNSDDWNIGGEFNYLQNSNSIKDNNQFGYSVYGKYNILDNVNMFLRYDYLHSNTLEGEATSWNIDRDGTKLIGGVEFSPIEKLKINLNYQDWTPSDSASEDESYLFVSVEVRF